MYSWHPHDYLSENKFEYSTSPMCNLILEPQSRNRVIDRTALFKEELMAVMWHPDRLGRVISKHAGMHWNFEEKKYTPLTWRTMPDIC